MADNEGFDGSTDDLLVEIRKMEKEKKELEKKNRDRQELEQRLKQLKGSVSSLKAGKSSSPQLSSRSTNENLSSESVLLNTSLEQSQARLRTLHESVFRSPHSNTSLHEDDDFNRSYEEFEDDVMSDQHKQALRENRDVLVENMTPDDIFNDLISKRILSNADVSRIKEKNTVEAINEELLNILVRRSDKAFIVFVSSLRRTLQGWLANRLDPVVESRGKRKRKTGELNVDVECERVLPQSKKRYPCTCREVEEQILIMAKVAFIHIRRRDGTSASFEQFRKELHQTNEAIKDSMEILYSLKVLCRHGDLSDLSEGSVRFTIKCSSFASCRRLWEDYMSGEILRAVEKSVITPSLLKICNAKRIFLQVSISKLEYLTCALELAGEEQQNLRSCHPHSRIIVSDIEQKRENPKRLCKRRIDENSPLNSKQVKISTTQSQRVLKNISPNILPTEELLSLEPEDFLSSFPSLNSESNNSNKRYGNKYLQKARMSSDKAIQNTFFINRKTDLSHIFPFSTDDVYHAWQFRITQDSPVYNTRSKTCAREANGLKFTSKRELLSEKKLKYFPVCVYNLRCRSIRI